MHFTKIIPLSLRQVLPNSFKILTNSSQVLLFQLTQQRSIHALQKALEPAPSLVLPQLLLQRSTSLLFQQS